MTQRPNLPIASKVCTEGELQNPRFSGKRIIVLAFLIMNLATGLPGGAAFGALVLPMAQRFNAPISIASLGMSLLILSSSLLALVMADLIKRYSIKALMTVGAALGASGHVVLALCTNIESVLISYALLIGPGMALLGFLPCYTLISRWYVEGQGRAFGIIGIPVIPMVMPLLITALLPDFGFRNVVLMIAAAHILALPLIGLVISRPEDVGQAPYLKVGHSIGASSKVATLTALQVLRDPIFLIIAVGSGLTMAPQIAKTILMMPIVTERGFGVEFSAVLLAISAISAAIGTLLFGALADRIGAATTLILLSISQAFAWVILVTTASAALLVVDAIVMGACAGGFMAPKSVLLLRVYGNSNYTLVMGMSTAAAMPFVFGMAPLMSLVRETTGGYTDTILLPIAALAVATICFIMIRSRLRKAGQRFI